MPSWDIPSFSSWTLACNKSTLNFILSFSTFRCSCSASALSFSILIVDYCSSNSSFLSSIPSCMIFYCFLSIICSLFNCNSSVKSDNKLLGDDLSFFFRVGTSSVVLLSQRVSTSIGLLLSTPFGFLSSASEISKALIEDMVDNGIAAGCITHDICFK